MSASDWLNIFGPTAAIAFGIWWEGRAFRKIKREWDAESAGWQRERDQWLREFEAKLRRPPFDPTTRRSF